MTEAAHQDRGVPIRQSTGWLPLSVNVMRAPLSNGVGESIGAPLPTLLTQCWRLVMMWLDVIEMLVPIRIAIVVFVATISCGCTNAASLLTTGSLTPAATQGLANDTQSRLRQVASTSARAKRCAFNFDPARLKTSYLDYERSQGATAEQVSKISESYDATLASKAKEVEGNPSYCSDRVTSLIKSALERHKAGDFTPTQGDPQAIVGVAAPAAPAPFDAGKFYTDRAKDAEQAR
jgi:hypothetical protein